MEKGVDIKICPIHGNKKYNCNPTHYCMYKIPGLPNSSCNCICTCLTPHREEHKPNAASVNFKAYDNLHREKHTDALQVINKEEKRGDNKWM